jgi:hypothetical protein
VEPLVEAEHESNPLKDAEIIEDNLKRFPQFTRAQHEAQLQEAKREKVYVNDTYQVNVRLVEKSYHGAPVVWLSIKRRDKAPVHDWRALQEIKNQLVGRNCEGVELYPAEDRVVDTSNQYHLWVIADPHFRWPFGFREGMKDYSQDARHSRQRPMGETAG